jgi:hypothetical protein
MPLCVTTGGQKNEKMETGRRSRRHQSECAGGDGGHAAIRVAITLCAVAAVSAYANATKAQVGGRDGTPCRAVSGKQPIEFFYLSHPRAQHAASEALASQPRHCMHAVIAPRGLSGR